MRMYDSMVLLLSEDSVKNNVEARKAIYRTTATLFGSIWSRRETVRLCDPGELQMGGIEVDGANLPEIVYAYYEVFRA